MTLRKMVFQQAAAVAVGQAVCAAVMIGAFALLGKFRMSVFWGGVVGGILALGNFFFMCLFADLAADQAKAQNVAGGQRLIQLSYMGRLLALIVVLVLCAKSGAFDLLALVLPLAFTGPILLVLELLQRKGGNQP